MGKPAKPSLARRIRDLTPALALRDTDTPWVNGEGAIEHIRNFAPAHPTSARYYVGTWTVPEGVTRIEVFVVGGGGCGGFGLNTDSGEFPEGGAGAGGGAGGYCMRVLEVEPGQVFPVTIGAGGNWVLTHPAINQALDGFSQGDGGRTTFGEGPWEVSALGGKAGSNADFISSLRHGGLGGAGTTYRVLVGGAFVQVRRFSGARGASAFHRPWANTIGISGDGGRSVLGSRGRGRTNPGPGGSPGPGGGGGGGGFWGEAGPGSSYDGGVGGSGVVVIRY